MINPPVELLHEWLEYLPEEGKLIWRKNNRKAKKGQEAGYVDPSGYRYVRVPGLRQLAHRVIWAMQTGEWPKEEIDHIDRVRDNNKWSNLREASPSQNQHNRGANRNNKTGLAGVRQLGKRFRAAIVLHRKSHYLGMFDTPEQASAAYQAAKAIYHKLGE